MTDSRCRIVCSAGKDETGSVADLVRQWAGESVPLLAWAEPDPLFVVVSNRTGRRDDFEPLVPGTPAWPEDLPLVEARLFWPDSALHVVAREGAGCAWARIAEVPAGQTGSEVARTAIPVYTLQDRSRFGLPEGPMLDGLQAIEYRQRGRLVAWRLLVEER